MSVERTHTARGDGAPPDRSAVLRRSSAPWRGVMAAWIVALLLAVVFAGARWATATGGSASNGATDGAPRSGPRPVFAPGAVPIDRVERIRVRRDGADLEFRRTPAGWTQVTPFEQPADGAQLRDLLVRAVDARVTRTTDAARADLAALGLEPPLALLELGWEGGSTRLSLGRRGVGGRAWLRVDDGPALAVDPALHDSIIDADPRRWRSWRLFDRAGADTRRIVIERTPMDGTGTPQRIELVRTEGRWRLESPIRARADSRAVETLLSALGRVEHSGFVDERPTDLSLYGLERPIASVELVAGATDGAGSERMLIGSGLVQGGALCARRDDRPPIVLLDRTAIAALLPPPAALVDGRACAVDPTDIRVIRVRDPDGALRFELTRTLDGWRLLEPGRESVAAREASIAALLERLVAARAQELAIQAMPEDLVTARVEIVPSVGPPTVVRVAREKGDGKWALDESDDCLRVFPPSFDPPLDAALFRGG